MKFILQIVPPVRLQTSFTVTTACVFVCVCVCVYRQLRNKLDKNHTEHMKETVKLC